MRPLISCSQVCARAKDMIATWSRWAERTHAIDQVQRGAHGSFGVVVVGDRRAPDGHDRVPDELLDGSAVALDDRACGVEVA